jgi:hypothetical protein
MVGQKYRAIRVLTRFAATYWLVGSRTSETLPTIKYTIQPFKLTDNDEQALRLDRTHIPRPVIESRFGSSFSLPVGCSIWFVVSRSCVQSDTLYSHFQLLAGGRCFLVVATADALLIYMDSISHLEAAVANGRFKTKIVYERIGRDFVLTFDESKRTMAIMATINVSISLLC